MDDPNYTPSATVLANSQRILEIVGGEASLDDTQKVTEENTANDTVIYENNGTTWEETAGSDDSGSTDPTTTPEEIQPVETITVAGTALVEAITTEEIPLAVTTNERRRYLWWRRL